MRSQIHSISHSSFAVMTLKRARKDSSINPSRKSRSMKIGGSWLGFCCCLFPCAGKGRGKEILWKCEPKCFCLRGRIIRRICSVNIQCSKEVRRNSAVCRGAENGKLGKKIAVHCGFTRAYGVLTELNGGVCAPYCSFL